jgi:hypothetical protein
VSILTPAEQRAHRHRAGTRRSLNIVRAQLAEATRLASRIDAEHGTGLSYAEVREAHALLSRAVTKLTRAYQSTTHEAKQHATAEAIGLAVGCVDCEDHPPGDGTSADAVLAGWIDKGQPGYPLWCCPNCQPSTTAVAR